MKKILIIAIVVVFLAILAFVAYRFIAGTGNSPAAPSIMQTGTLPSAAVSAPTVALGQATSSNYALPTSSIPDYAGTASEIFGNVPTGTLLSIGTSHGTVEANNFYAPNLPVDQAGDLIIKDTAGYLITYDPNDGSFWLAITGTPFATWREAAEQDFVQTLGITQDDACKLDVTSGIIYSVGDPNDGQSFPLSFCVSSGAFGQ